MEDRGHKHRQMHRGEKISGDIRKRQPLKKRSRHMKSRDGDIPCRKAPITKIRYIEEAPNAKKDKQDYGTR